MWIMTWTSWRTCGEGGGPTYNCPLYKMLRREENRYNNSGWENVFLVPAICRYL